MQRLKKTTTYDLKLYLFHITCQMDTGNYLLWNYGRGAERAPVQVPPIDAPGLAKINVTELIEDRLMQSHKRAIRYLSDRFDRLDRLRRLSSQCIIPQSANKVQQYLRLFRACSAMDSAVSSLEDALVGTTHPEDVGEAVNIPPQFAGAPCPQEDPQEAPEQEKEEEERVIACGL